MEVQLEGHTIQKKNERNGPSVSQSHSQLVSHSSTRSLNHSLTHSATRHLVTQSLIIQSLNPSVNRSRTHSVIGHTFALYSAPTAFSTFPRFDESPAKHISRQ